MTAENLDELADKIAAKLQRPDDRPLLTATGLAERLGVSERKARELMGSGEIASLKIDGSRRVEPSAVDAYIEQQKGAA